MPISDSFGRMLHLGWPRNKLIKLATPSERKFIDDCDTIVMLGCGEKDEVRIGSGEVWAKAVPAVEQDHPLTPEDGFFLGSTQHG